MYDISRRQVLVVDDAYLIRDLLIDFFSLNDCRTAGARNGAEALRMLKERRFSMLLTDLYMPVMNGIELIRAVRKLNMPLTIVGMSALEKEQTFLKAGADYFVLKPFDFPYLKSILDAVSRLDNTLPFDT
jgi:CheY-like chemotaxis protein